MQGWKLNDQNNFARKNNRSGVYCRTLSYLPTDGFAFGPIIFVLAMLFGLLIPSAGLDRSALPPRIGDYRS